MKIKRKSKLQSKTPLLFAVSKEQMLWIKQVPYLSLMSYRDNKGTKTDWFNICVRLSVGVNLSRIVCEEETTSEIKAILDKTLLLFKDKEIIISPELSSEIEGALVAINEIEDLTTRKQQLPEWKKANAFMKQYVGIKETK
jgi:hypothetical protein